MDRCLRNVQTDSLHFLYTAVSVKPSKGVSQRTQCGGLRDSDTNYFVHLRIKEAVVFNHYP